MTEFDWPPEVQRFPAICVLFRDPHPLQKSPPKPDAMRPRRLVHPALGVGTGGDLGTV